MQLQFLRTLKIPAAIRTRLGELPKDLRETYDETYNLRLISDVEEQSSIAENAFKLLLCLQTPLGHRDFLHALSFCGDDQVNLCSEELLDLCCNFLVLDTELDVFRFAHLSVREYLETRTEYTSESSHALAAQFCLRYLCTSNASGPFFIPRDTWSEDSVVPKDADVSSIDLESDSRVMSWTIDPSLTKEQLDKNEYPCPNHVQEYACAHCVEYPFLNHVQEYACAYWADHAAGSRHLLLVHPLSTMLREFMMDASQVVSPWFMYWNRLAIHMEYFRGSCMPRWSSCQSKVNDMTHVPADYLFTACLWGFYDLLKVRLRLKPDPMLVRSNQRENALQLVCKYGICDVAEFFLDRDWDLQVENGQSLLDLAIEGEHIETIRLLLSRGIDPNEKYYDEGCSNFPIIKALEVESTEVVKILLGHGASADVEDLSSPHLFGLKTFHLADLWGHQEMSNLLLAASTVDDFHRSICKDVVLVHRALRDWDGALLNEALENWPQDARANWYLDVALRQAISRTDEAFVIALLRKGANVDFKIDGESAIELFSKVAPSWARHHSIMQLLLDSRCSRRGRTDYGN